MILPMILLSCVPKQADLPTVSMVTTSPPKWAWFGPLPCSYEKIATVEGTAWTSEEALVAFEELVEGEADHVLLLEFSKEKINISPATCDEADIPSCFEEKTQSAQGHSGYPGTEEIEGTDGFSQYEHTTYYVERWHFKGEAIRWIRELCGGWPDTTDSPPTSVQTSVQIQELTPDLDD